MKLWDSVNNVLKRLDDYPADNQERVWSRDEVTLYLEDGYNSFCRQTKCLFDYYYPENVPPCGNWVARWEREEMTSGMISQGQMNYTGGYWERDYAEAGDIGPIASTQPWEEEYVETIFSAFYPMPEDNVSVLRAMFDLHQLSPEFTRWYEQNDRSYQTTQGDPWSFSMDRDGISAIRTVPVGSGNASEPETVGTYGLMRDTSFLDSDLFRVGCLGYWRLDETTGSRYAYAAGATLTDNNSTGYDTGHVGNAAKFLSASTQYLNNTSAIALAAGSPFTLSFWIKPDADIGANWGVFLNGQNVYGNGFAVGSFNVGATYLMAHLTDSGGGIYTTYVADLDLDTWSHIVVTYDGTTLQMYRNNSTTGVVTADSWTPAAISAGALEFGRVSTAYFKGLFDEVLYLNRVASAAEIKSLYEYKDTAATVYGSRGVLREWSGEHPMGAQYGIPRRRYYDTKNTRVEYARLGGDIEEDGFELPERYMRYVEYYAAAKALEREGPGQDLKLASHFMQRFVEGVDRMILRLTEHRRSVAGKIGSDGRVPTKRGLARLPWHYGKQIRRGY